VKISGQGVAATISLDGEDVDEDIYLFFEAFLHKIANSLSRFPAAKEGSTRAASKPSRETFHRGVYNDEVYR
jgi:hypothetical protein